MSAGWRLAPGKFDAVGVGSSSPFKVPSVEVYAKLLNQLLSTPYQELAAHLSKARLYIGPDAGPKHMATAARTPVVEICFVPADFPALSRGPRTAGASWTGISADSLLDAVERVLAETSQPLEPGRRCGSR